MFATKHTCFGRKYPTVPVLYKRRDEPPISQRMKNEANSSCFVRPLLIYQSENPCVFKKHNEEKIKLPVMWMTNRKDWVSIEYFSNWFNVIFGLSIEKIFNGEKCL